MDFGQGFGECVNPECCHEEPNGVGVCRCGREIIVRDPHTLLSGSVVAYDPFCGFTVGVR